MKGARSLSQKLIIGETINPPGNWSSYPPHKHDQLKDTEDLVGEKELKFMKPTAFLINVARGKIVNEKALAKALKEEWIAGAASDVFSEEPPDPDNPLLKIKNIILSPHVAALTKECVIRMATGAAQGILDVLRGNKAKYIANLDFIKK